jgi:ABC-type dipeptide/oligopeptide/nickel transport system permease component
MYAALTILGTFLSDVLLALLDPRIRYGERV